MKYCPHLAIPAAQRREANLPATAQMSPFGTIEKPDVFGLLLTDDFQVLQVGSDILFRAKSVVSLTWWWKGQIIDKP